MKFSEIVKELGEKTESLSASERESLYSIAYGKYQIGEYRDAVEMFINLILQDPYETRYWNGLAGSKQMQRDYEGALRAWGVLSLLGNHPPEAHFHAAECCLSMGEIEETKKALACAKLHLNKDNPLFDRIEILYQQVNQCPQ